VSARKLGGAAIVCVSAILLYFSLRGIDWRIVRRTVLSISPGLALLSLVLGIIPMFLRAARWRLLLQAEAPVPFRMTFWAVAAGYFGNNFLPARGGELVRSYIVRMRSELSLSYVLATALSERVADAVALMIFAAVAMRSWLFLLVGMAGACCLIVLPRMQKPLARILQNWPRLQSIAQQLLLGVQSFHNARRILQFTALTIGIWFIDAVSTATLARALSIPMTVSIAMLLIVALSLSSALPSTPGYIGIYQFAAIMVLKPFGISSSAAIAFMLVMQAINYMVTGVLGLLAMTCFTPFNWQSSRRPPQPIQTQN
jgi:uncharacterized membrane protein YbhN (UPF0104 family)